MKKFFVLTAVCAAMFLMISCGSSSESDDNGNNDGNKACTEVDLYKNGKCNGHDAGYCTEGEKMWYEVDGTDKKFYCDGYGTCETAYSELMKYCTGSAESDSEDESETPSEISECSANAKFPCKDSQSGLIWSTKKELSWAEYDDSDTLVYPAKTYCDNLTEGGYSDWRLPTIDEVRTLIQNCEGTVSGGSCAVSDPDHLSQDNDWTIEACYYCDAEQPGFNPDIPHSKLGETDNYWSSSVISDYPDSAWGVAFEYGNVNGYGMESENSVRCVRNAE